MRRPNYVFCELCDSYVNECRLYENVQKRLYKSKEISHQLAKKLNIYELFLERKRLTCVSSKASEEISKMSQTAKRKQEQFWSHE